jgi:tetratricopeptide (TPR) repeat protein
MLESGQILAARYTLLRKLAGGGATQLWQVRDREAGVDRVLKVLVSASPAQRARFLASAQLQGQVRHPNVQPCETVVDGDPAFAVFPAVAPGDLSSLRGRPWRELLPVLAAIADGLAALHGHGIVHRDLKPANVLLGTDGEPWLADFGLAARVGDASAPAEGSPFSMSPQQFEGAAPSIGDDVYGFGALAYEVLTGYPPFYPEAHRERVLSDPPAPMPRALAVPDALEQLVLRCLAKRAEDRPRGLPEIAETLRALAVVPATEPRRPVVTPVELRPPPAPEGAIDPQWKRAASPAASPEQLRSQGFRRGLVASALAFLLLAAGFVFIALPRWVERQAAAPPPSQVESVVPGTAAAPDPGEPPDLQKLAEAKRAFEELRPAVAARLEALEARGAAAWGGETFARAGRGVPDADAAFGARDHFRALDLLRAAEADLQATETSADNVLDAALVAGAAALAAGSAAEATRQFERALQIDPGNARARRGLERAGSLDEVRRLLAEAGALEREGQSASALAAYRQALALDRDAGAAREGIARLEGQAAQAAFAAAISQGLDALGREDFATARAAFERAAGLRPDAPEVTDGLARVERGLGDRAIGEHLAAAGRAEREERWADALAEYRKALAVDRNLLAARQGVERSEPRAMLDAELRAFLERPERMFSTEVRGAARAALGRARAIASPGPVLGGQVASVERLVDAAETPVQVALASDNLTDVTIYRVGRLGTFERKDVDLLPGRYTVVGVRAGFRDVRRELNVPPGGDAPMLVIRCEEPI